MEPMESNNHELQSPEGRRLAGLLYDTQKTATLLIHRTRVALGRRTAGNDELTDTERETYARERSITLREAPAILLATAASILVSMQENENDELIEELAQTTERHGDNQPERLVTDITALIARTGRSPRATRGT